MRNYKPIFFTVLLVILSIGCSGSSSSKDDDSVENPPVLNDPMDPDNANVLPIMGVNASDFQSPDIPEASFDDSLQTQWSAQGNQQWIQYDLGSVKSVTYLGIAWHKGDQRNYSFEVQVSVNGEQWSTIIEGVSGGTTHDLQFINLKDTSSRYLRYVGLGNSENNWNQISELKILGWDTNLNILNIRASDVQHPNIAENTLDGDFDTRWSANGSGQWLQYDLGTIKTIKQLEIAWYKGDERKSFFEIQSSIDGLEWAQVFAGESRGTTLSLQTIAIEETEALYVKYIGLGNSINNWNSITELRLLGQEPEHEIADVSASAFQSPNRPENSLDMDLTSHWAAQGEQHWIQYDLAEAQDVSHLEIAWLNGDQLHAFFEIQLSTNGADWITVFDGESSGLSNSHEAYFFANHQARLIRIVVHGNTLDNWNRISSIQINGPDSALKPKNEFRALVIHYNPNIIDNDETIRTVSNALDLRAVEPLMDAYINALKRASSGQANWQVVNTLELDEFPPENDPDVTYTPQNFLQHRRTGYDMLGRVDYNAIIADPRFDIKNKIESESIDAIWIFSFPGAGFWETAMAGDGAYYINGGPIRNTNINKKFVLYGFGNEAHQHYGFMLENTGHMVENILARRGDNWPAKWSVPIWNSFEINSSQRYLTDIKLNDWQFFHLTDALNYDSPSQNTGLEHLSAPGNSQVGTVHYPPNAMYNYGWSKVVENFRELARWVSYGGNWYLSGGTYRIDSDKSGKSILHDNRNTQRPYSMSDFNAEGEVSMENTSTSSHAGYLFRMQKYSTDTDEDRGYYVAIDDFRNAVVLYKMDSGLIELASAPAQINSNTAYKLVISAQADNLKIYLDDSSSPLIQFTDNSFSTGGFGISAHNTSAEFDNIELNVSVLNHANKWDTYPVLSGSPKSVNSTNWNSEHGSYLSWWFEHIPKNSGTHDGGILNSWWPYIFDINHFDPENRYANIQTSYIDTEEPWEIPEIGILELGYNYARLAWYEPFDDVGVTRYDIYRNGVFIQQVSNLNYTDIRLQQNTEYNYQVVALDASANSAEPISIRIVTLLENPVGLQNGNFEQGFSETVSYWTADPWKPAHASMSWEQTGEGTNGSRSISIEHTEENDSRWIQTVTGLIPGANYTLSGDIKGQDILNVTGTTGANLGVFKFGPITNRVLRGTFDWTNVETNFTAPDSGSIVIACRLGHFGNTTTGKAWFDNIKIVLDSID